jgi:hypothetical protein
MNDACSTLGRSASAMADPFQSNLPTGKLDKFAEVFSLITLADITHADFARLDSFDSAEVIMWLITHDAMSSRVRCVHKDYDLPSKAGIAVALWRRGAARGLR